MGPSPRHGEVFQALLWAGTAFRDLSLCVLNLTWVGHQVSSEPDGRTRSRSRSFQSMGPEGGYLNRDKLLRLSERKERRPILGQFVAANPDVVNSGSIAHVDC